MHFTNVSPLEKHIAYESHRIKLQRIICLPYCVCMYQSVSLCECAYLK